MTAIVAVRYIASSHLFAWVTGQLCPARLMPSTRPAAWAAMQLTAMRYLFWLADLCATP